MLHLRQKEEAAAVLAGVATKLKVNFLQAGLHTSEGATLGAFQGSSRMFGQAGKLNGALMLKGLLRHEMVLTLESAYRGLDQHLKQRHAHICLGISY